jgi:hypothetical protein
MRARDRVSGEAKLQTGRHAIHGLRIAGLADGADESVLDADVGFHHALHRVNDCDVGDDEVGRSGLPRQPVVHAHAFAQALAAPEHDLVAKPTAQVALDLNKQPCIAQSNAIADRWTK